MQLIGSKRLPSIRGKHFFTEEWESHGNYSEATVLFQEALSGRRHANNLEAIRDYAEKIADVSGIIEEHGIRFISQLSTDIPHLPATYGFKGGVAREQLRTVFGSTPYPVRDIDLIRLGHGSISEDVAMASKFMADDFARGNGVELVRSEQQYFNSRDLTVNEVFFLNNTLLASPFCILDTLSKTLRATRYRSGSLSRPPQLVGGTLLKMLRIRAELFTLGECWRLVGIPTEVSVSDGELALQLEKSLQRSESVATTFLEYCLQLGIIEGEKSSILFSILEDLIHFTYGDGAIIKSIPSHLRERMTPLL